MFHRHQRISLFLIFAAILSCGIMDRSLDLNNGPVRSTWTVYAASSVSAIPISFDTSAKTGQVSGTTASVVIGPKANDMLIVEEYDTCCPTVTVSDSQGNTFSRFPNNNVAGANPLSQNVFNARVLSSISDNITVTLSSAKTFAVLVAAYTGVASVVGSTAADLQQSTPTYSIAGQANSAPNNISIPAGSAIAPGLTPQASKDWVVGVSGNSIQDTCLGGGGVCLNSACTLAVGCLNQVQRIFDFGTTISGELTDAGGPLPSISFAGPCDSRAAPSVGTGWCWLETVNHGAPSNREFGWLGAIVDLVCCFVPPPDSPGGSPPPLTEDPRVDILIGSGVAVAILAAMLFFIVGPRRKRA